MQGRILARHALAVTAVATLGMPTPAYAGLPKPVIERAQEAAPMIYDAQLGSLDSNGRFAIHLVGQHLAPDDYGHPAQNADYVHLYVRGVDASNRAGDWRRCGDDTCFLYGSTAMSGINVGIRPSYYLSQPGSHLQFKVWVSPRASMAGEPDGYESSPWSDIYTVDRAQAGVAAPVKASPGPTLVRLSPDHFTQMGSASRSWQLTAYGERVCGDPPVLVINGDVGGAVTATGRCMGYDESGKPLAGKESRLVFDLPERYRALGSYSVNLLNEYGQSSGSLSYEVRGMRVNREGLAPRIGVDMQPLPQPPVVPTDEAVAATPPVVVVPPPPPPVKIVPIVPILKMPPRPR